MLRRIIFYIFLCCSLVVIGSGCSTTAPEVDVVQTTPVKPQITQVAIVKTVDAEQQIYRSKQPSRSNFATLEQAGLKSILNLRNYHSDSSKIKNTSLVEYHLRSKAGSFSEADIFEALKILRDAPKPILIHCWHGADRTGTVVASYRIAMQNWTVEAAIEEMLLPEYGHHSTIYDNLPKLLRSINWDAMRQKLNTK